MHILIITTNFPSKFSKHGGIFTFNRVKALVNQGVKVSVILLNSCISRGLNARYLKRYNTKDLMVDNEFSIDVHVINFINVPLVKQAILGTRIRSYVKKIKCDLVHFHFLWSVYGIKELSKIKQPVIITCHGSDVHQLPGQKKSDICASISNLNKASHVIFVSNFLKDVAEQLGYQSRHTSTIPNGINLNMFNYKKIEKKEAPCVGYFGNLFPIKRVHLLPEIFDEVAKKNQSVSFIIAGSGPELQSLKEKAAKLKLQITFLPKFNHSQFVDYLKLIDVIVMPSKFEGFPCIPIEAKAMGIPTVGSRNGGIPEAIMEDGALIDDGPHMINDFAQAIVGLIEQPLNGETLVEHAKPFSWKHIINDEINVYQDVLSRSTSVQ